MLSDDFLQAFAKSTKIEDGDYPEMARMILALREKNKLALKALDKIDSRISAWISVATEGVEAEGEIIDPPLGEPVRGFLIGCNQILADIEAAIAGVRCKRCGGTERLARALVSGSRRCPHCCEHEWIRRRDGRQCCLCDTIEHGEPK
jgi:hypothetical protein